MPVTDRTIFFFLFALSGFTGLIYESIWTHYLKLFLGHAAYAQALVLSIFMGGLALGSWICGRYSDRWHNLLWGYAAAEAALGVFALLFHTVFDFSTQASFSSIIPKLGSSLSITLFKWTFASLLILPQTVLLGMTFPLMAAGLTRGFPNDSGKSIATLYFLNSLGAAIGVLTSAFLLIRLVGLPGTIRTAGIINLGIGICAWLLAKGFQAGTPMPETACIDDGKKPDLAWYRLLLAVSMMTGAASFIYEIGWIRMLSLVLGSSTHAFELMLSAFIFGLAFGGLWVWYRIGHTADSVSLLIRVQIVMGLCALSSLVLYGTTFDVMQWLVRVLPKTDTGYALFNGASLGIALLIMFPAAFCAGMTLPLITTSLLRRGHGEKSIGFVYAANTVGAITGVFFAIHVGMPALGLKWLIISGAGIDIALGLGLSWFAATKTHAYKISAAASAACLCIILAAGFLVELDKYNMASGVYRFGALESSESGKLIFHKDGKTATVSSFLTEGGLDIRTNGKADAQIQLDPSLLLSQDEPMMILVAVIPLSLNPEAKKIANIGFGSGLTAATFLRDRSIDEIDTIEIEPVMVEAAKNFGPIVEEVYTDARSGIRIEDAKTFFSAQGRKYDIIVSEPSNPWVSGVAGLFSKEYYHLIRRYLTDNGIFCQWLQLYEMDEALVFSVLKAVSESFSDYVIYASDHGNVMIVARDGAPITEPDIAALGRPGITDILKRVEVEGIQDIILRRVGDKKMFFNFLASYPVEANSDYYPYLDQNAARARFFTANADDIVNFIQYPLPIYEVVRDYTPSWSRTTITPSHYLDRSNNAFAAMALRDYYLTGSFHEDYAGVPYDRKDMAIRLGHMFFDDCSAGPRDRIDLLHRVIGMQMVPYLLPGELNAVWKKLEAGACTSRFTPEERRWVDLIKAAGKRDSGSMVYNALSLLEKEHDLPQNPTSYLVASGMMGYLTQGDRQHSMQVWNTYGQKISEGDRKGLLFRLLVALSSGK